MLLVLLAIPVPFAAAEDRSEEEELLELREGVRKLRGHADREYA